MFLIFCTIYWWSIEPPSFGCVFSSYKQRFFPEISIQACLGWLVLFNVFRLLSIEAVRCNILFMPFFCVQYLRTMHVIVNIFSYYQSLWLSESNSVVCFNCRPFKLKFIYFDYISVQESVSNWISQKWINFKIWLYLRPLYYQLCGQ